MENIELKVLSQTGKEVSTITLDKEVFGVEVNEQVMFDAVMTYLANRRQATAKTKKRHEVSGGGTVFGPDGNQNFKIKQNKKEHKLALKSALTKQVNNLVVLDNLTVEGKTKEVVSVLKALNIANNKVLLVSEDEKVLQGSRNLNNVLIVSKNNISVYDLLNSETLVMVEADVKELEEGLK